MELNHVIIKLYLERGKAFRFEHSIYKLRTIDKPDPKSEMETEKIGKFI